VHKHFTRVGARYFVGGHAAIRAANPEKIGVLGGREGFKIFVVEFKFVLNPGFVISTSTESPGWSFWGISLSLALLGKHTSF
jgi:hypothetical protein